MPNHEADSFPPKIDLRSAFIDSFVRDVEDADPDVPSSGSGAPLFTQEDVDACTDRFARLLRGIYVDRGVTRQMFKIMHKHYATHILGCSPSLANRMRNNLLKAILRNKVTNRTFTLALATIGLHLDNVTVLVHDRDGRRFIYSGSNDASDIIELDGSDYDAADD
jgi:hypothetical protein